MLTQEKLKNSSNFSGYSGPKLVALNFLGPQTKTCVKIFTV